MKSKTMLIWLGVLAGVGSLQAASPQTSISSPASAPNSQYRAVLDKYCVTCHNQKLKTAGLMLDKLDLRNVPADAEVWEKAIRKLRTGAMPPTGLPRPDKATYNSLATYLETTIDRAALAKPNPGTPTLHRLNRAEYANAVRDLLGVQINVESLLPGDDAGYGFDNNGDVLSVSPALLDRYLIAARRSVRLAIGDSAARPTTEVYQVPGLLVQDDRMGEDTPLGSRGGMAVSHNFPADGEYLVRVSLKREGELEGETVRGVALKRHLSVLLDESELKLFPVGGQSYGKSVVNRNNNANCTKGVLASCRGDDKQEEYERHGVDEGLEVRIPVTAGPHEVAVAFQVENTAEPEVPFRSGGTNPRRGGKTVEPWVGTVTISGPYEAKGVSETPSRRKIFVCRPTSGTETAARIPVRVVASKETGAYDEEGCARKVISTLAHRAYRRPVTSADMEPLVKIYRIGRKERNFDTGIGMALEAMLSDPQFLFRIESDPANMAPGMIYRLSDLDLASRLSFFLWSSIPDDELLSVAERGKLKDPAVLEQQVRRMLPDPRAKALVSNFAGQWLQLRRMDRVSPDFVEFPYFDETLKQAFHQETELFLESMILPGRPLMEMFDADYTFLNERLASHYGIPNVYGSSFRRVALTDENRKGLLGQGSILSLTSYPTRTSVVLRGVWLLTNIFGTPPPAPPPGVPSLKDRNDDGQIKSVRESMEQHRASPVCATCHSRIDPLGFAMENFDAVGAWRTKEGAGETAIDTSGALPDGTKFQGPVELRKVLLDRSDRVVTAVTEKLLTYAMGRGAEYYDQPVVRKIMREAAPDYRWSSLILGIVKSEPFQMRKARGG